MKSSLLSSQASDAESYEVQQLQSMFSSGSGFSGRGSSIPVGLYVKFEVSMDNRQKAEEARRDRQKRDQIRMDKARRQYEETQERRAKVLGRNATVKQEMVERNLEQGKMARAHGQRVILSMRAQRGKERAEGIMNDTMPKLRFQRHQELARTECRRDGH